MGVVPCITLRQGPTLPKWLNISVRLPFFVALPYAQTADRFVRTWARLSNLLAFVTHSKINDG